MAVVVTLSVCAVAGVTTAPKAQARTTTTSIALAVGGHKWTQRSNGRMMTGLYADKGESFTVSGRIFDGVYGTPQGQSWNGGKVPIKIYRQVNGHPEVLWRTVYADAYTGSFGDRSTIDKITEPGVTKYKAKYEVPEFSTAPITRAGSEASKQINIRFPTKVIIGVGGTFSHDIAGFLYYYDQFGARRVFREGTPVAIYYHHNGMADWLGFKCGNLDCVQKENTFLKKVTTKRDGSFYTNDWATPPISYTAAFEAGGVAYTPSWATD